jgi:2-hydroxychromene-2-carboxylate isomerase
MNFPTSSPAPRPFGPKRRNLATVGLQKVMERAGLPAKEYHDVDHGLDQHAAPVVRRSVFAAPTFFVGNETFLCSDLDFHRRGAA